MGAVVKESLRSLRRKSAQPEPGKPKIDDDGTPECIACGEHNIGLGSDAVVMLRGRWMPYLQHDVAGFVVDPETAMQIEQLPNGQLLLIPDVHGHPTKHAHTECIRDLVNDLIGVGYDEYEDEDDYEEDEEDYE